MKKCSNCQQPASHGVLCPLHAATADIVNKIRAWAKSDEMLKSLAAIVRDGNWSEAESRQKLKKICQQAARQYGVHESDARREAAAEVMEFLVRD